MKLSILIPANNEAESLPSTLRNLFSVLTEKKINHEIIVIDDHSEDDTLRVLEEVKKNIDTLRWYSNPGQKGFGSTVRYGLDHFEGNCAAIVMADASDDPYDLARFYETMVNGGYDCVFGSRFMTGSVITGYPLNKRILNRLGNNLVRLCFNLKYNDITNAFKLYSKKTIDNIKPFRSAHFDLTIELPLKAIIQGCSYAVVPNSWTSRKSGKSKFNIWGTMAGYFSTLIYCYRNRRKMKN